MAYTELVQALAGAAVFVVAIVAIVAIVVVVRRQQ